LKLETICYPGPAKANQNREIIPSGRGRPRVVSATEREAKKPDAQGKRDLAKSFECRICF
jgi:hypothetical protein